MRLSRAEPGKAPGFEVPRGVAGASCKIPLPHPRQAGVQQGTCSKPAGTRTTPDSAFSVPSSLKQCSTLLEENNVNTTCKPSILPFNEPISHQHSAALGHWVVAQPWWGNYRQVKSPGEKTSLPVQPKGLSPGKVSGRMPSPLLSCPEEQPRMEGPAPGPWKDLGVTQEGRRKGGKLTPWALLS